MAIIPLEPIAAASGFMAEVSGGDALLFSFETTCSGLGRWLASAIVVYCCSFFFLVKLALTFAGVVYAVHIFQISIVVDSPSHRTTRLFVLWNNHKMYFSVLILSDALCLN